MKRCFLTGLAILLPLFLTAIVALFIINFLTRPFLGISEQPLSHFELLDKGFLFFSGEQLILYVSKLLSLTAFFALTIILGIAAQWFAIRKSLQYAEKIFHKIPLINKIYKATQEVVKAVFLSKRRGFGQVVFVPFPHEGGLSLGLITRHANIKTIEKTGPLVSVFVPATPNPMMGFMLLFPKEKVIYTDMAVEDAFKSILSCGSVQQDFKISNGLNLAELPTELQNQKL